MTSVEAENTQVGEQLVSYTEQTQAASGGRDVEFSRKMLDRNKEAS